MYQFARNIILDVGREDYATPIESLEGLPYEERLNLETELN